MAIPTFTAITPNTGASHGDELVRLTGTNFGVGIEVKFGGVAGRVLTLYQDAGVSVADVFTPKGPPEPGAVAVSIQNLDEDGAPVAGELVSAAGAFTFARADSTQESDLGRLVRTMIQSLKREVLPAVGSGVDVDFDEDPDADGRAVKLAEPPSITIALMAAPENRLMRDLTRRAVPVGGGGHVFQLRPTMTVDLQFSLIVQTDHRMQLLNLVHAIARWLQANPRISMLRDAADPSAGSSRWRMNSGDWKFPTGRDGLNVATLDLTIRGFHLHEGLPLNRTRPVDDVVVTTTGG